ncbi:seryl-tRNA synthetase family protein [Streptococcus pneumoniae]|nr:seryl-tRNA synthetase family protein [Streptococcus pneumoniae]
MAEFTFEIEEHLLTLSENEKGWTKEINRVSFNGAPAKFDIRAWSPDHTKMGKGITLSNEEFQTMVDAFKGNLYFSKISSNHVSVALPYASPYDYVWLLTSSVIQTSKHCFEQPAASFLVCSLIFIEYKFSK